MKKLIFWNALFVWAVGQSSYEAIHGDRGAVWFLIAFSILFAVNHLLDDALKYLDEKIAEYER